MIPAPGPRPALPTKELTDEAEHAICTTLLREPERWQEAHELRAEDFRDRLYGLAFEAIVAECAAGRRPGPVAIEAHIAQRGYLESYRGAHERRLLLVEDAPAVGDNLGTLARLIRRRARALAMSSAVDELRRRLIEERDITSALARLDLARAELASVEGGGADRSLPTAAERVFALWSEVRPPRLPTCFPGLNKMLRGGLLRGRNTLLISPTGRGKSSIAGQLARGWVAAGHHVLYISTELPEDEVYARLLGQVLRRPWTEVLEWGPSFAPDMRDRAAEHLGTLLVIDYDREQTIGEIMARYIAERGVVPILIVDVLQDLATAYLTRGAKGDARAATRLVSAELKALARERNAVIFALSHTNRATSKDKDKHLRTASDFESAGRDSADLEQDAAVVLFLDADDCPPDGQADARLHLAKAAGAGRGQTLGLRYTGAIGTFEEAPDAVVAAELYRALCAIAEGAVGRDPLRKALGIASVRASELLDALERRRLIVRSKRGIKLTPEGSALVGESGSSQDLEKSATRKRRPDWQETDLDEDERS